MAELVHEDVGKHKHETSKLLDRVVVRSPGFPRPLRHVAHVANPL